MTKAEVIKEAEQTMMAIVRLANKPQVRQRAMILIKAFKERAEAKPPKKEA